MVEKANLRAGSAGLMAGRADLKRNRADFRPERADLRPEWGDLRHERANLNPISRAGFSQISELGPMNENIIKLIKIYGDNERY